MKAFSRWPSLAAFQRSDFDIDYATQFRQQFTPTALSLLDLGKEVLVKDAFLLAERYDVPLTATRKDTEVAEDTAAVLQENLDVAWKSVLEEAVSSSSVSSRFRRETYIVLFFAFRVESMLRSVLGVHHQVLVAFNDRKPKSFRIHLQKLLKFKAKNGLKTRGPFEQIMGPAGLSWQQALVFGLKLSASLTLAALLSFPSWPTRSFFIDYIHLWTLITIDVLLFPTVGASSSKSAWRLAGTLLGGVIGIGQCRQVLPSPFDNNSFCIVLGVASSGNDVLAVVLLAVISYPLYYIRQGWKAPWPGLILIAQMTYCAILFLTYRGDESTETVLKVAMEIAIRTGIGIGVVLIASLYVAPIRAREEMQKGVADILRDLATMYISVVQCFEAQIGSELGETLTTQLGALMNTAVANEKRVIRKMEYVQDMLPLASVEPSLPWTKKFQRDDFVKLLSNCARCIDRISVARLAVQKAPSQSVFTALFGDELLNPLRRSLMERRVLFCYALSGALFTDLPLPPLLPRMQESRETLLRRMREVAEDNEAKRFRESQSDEGKPCRSKTWHPASDFVYFSAFVLAMEGFEQAMLEMEQSIANIVGRIPSPFSLNSI
jgi:hypothetical protein